MDQKILLLLFVLLVIACVCASMFEGFTDYGYYKRYCSSCGYKSRRSCGKCINCGYCISSSGYGECVAGDSSGPYFRQDCVYWEYGDPYHYYPYSHMYPSVKIKSMYPHYRWKTRRQKTLKADRQRKLHEKRRSRQGRYGWRMRNWL